MSLVAPPLHPAPVPLQAEVQSAGTTFTVDAPVTAIPTTGAQLISTVYIKDDVNRQLYLYHTGCSAPLNVVSLLISLTCWLNISLGLASQPKPKKPLKPGTLLALTRGSKHGPSMLQY